MGCDRYSVGGTSVKFSESDDCGCLCTFDDGSGAITHDDVRLLAWLGAAVVLLRRGKLVGPVFLPDGLPESVRRGIDRIVLGVAND